MQSIDCLHKIWYYIIAPVFHTKRRDYMPAIIVNTYFHPVISEQYTHEWIEQTSNPKTLLFCKHLLAAIAAYKKNFPNPDSQDDKDFDPKLYFSDNLEPFTAVCFEVLFNDIYLNDEITEICYRLGFAYEALDDFDIQRVTFCYYWDEEFYLTLLECEDDCVFEICQNIHGEIDELIYEMSLEDDWDDDEEDDCSDVDYYDYYY